MPKPKQSFEKKNGLSIALPSADATHVLFPKIVNPSLAGISKSKQLEIYREDWLAVNFLGLSWLKPTNPDQNCARDTIQHPARQVKTISD